MIRLPAMSHDTWLLSGNPLDACDCERCSGGDERHECDCECHKNYDRVGKQDACPICGEDRIDTGLELQDRDYFGESVVCLTCGIQYGLDARPVCQK